MDISNRLPGWRQLAQVYAIIVLMIYSWTILWFFWKLPGWLLFLTVGELLGVLAFSLVTNLLESLAILCLPVVLSLCLPRKWFRDVFVARGGTLVAAVLGYMMFLGEAFKHEMEFPRLSLTDWQLVLPLAPMVLVVYLAGRLGWLRRVAEVFADRATIFLYLTLPLSGIAMLVTAFRRVM